MRDTVTTVVLLGCLALVYRLTSRYPARVRETAGSRDQLRAVLNGIPAMIAYWDRDLHNVMANDAYVEYFGFTPEQMLGRHIQEIIGPELYARNEEHLRKALAGESQHFDRAILDTQGAPRHLDSSYLPDIVDGQTRGFFVLVTDVTELKIAEAAALEASRAKSQFLAAMSHEIRTPMNGVIGLADLLQTTTLDADQTRYVRGIQTAGQSLMDVINDILDFSKIEAGKILLESRAFDLGILVQDVAAVTGHIASRKGIRLTTAYDDSLPRTLTGDPGRIRQILMNLVGNAIKFTAEGSVAIRVSVALTEWTIESGGSTSEPGQNVTKPEEDPARPVRICLEVIDTGIGIEPSAIPGLFEPFQQADSSTTRTYGGTGLGLTISRQLVEAMGGSISVTSIPGEGTTMLVALPLVESQSDAVERAVDRAVLRILVVSDDERDRRLLCEQIQRWGLQADAIDGSGEQARERVRGNAGGQRYDLVIVDDDLTGTPAAQLIRNIADEPGSARTPIVLMSGTDGDSHRVRGDGVTAILTKPINQSSLYDVLALVRPAAPAGPPVRPTATSRGRILLAEDNKVNQMVAKGMLTNLGYTVDIASDGQEALDLAGRTVYQAILMDCHMPRVDGYTATARLRTDPATAHTPIIALTANALREDRDRCLAAGMDDYVAKPFRIDDLDAVLVRWADQRSGAPQAPAAPTPEPLGEVRQ